MVDFRLLKRLYFQLASDDATPLLTLSFPATYTVYDQMSDLNFKSNGLITNPVLLLFTQRGCRIYDIRTVDSVQCSASV